MRGPFFIIGCNRSGTSLVRTMLNHHPEVAVPTETVFFVDYLERSVEIKTLRKFIINEPGLKELRIKLKVKDTAKIKSVKDAMEVVHYKYAWGNGKKYWGNKTPRFTMYLEEIEHMFSDSVFINIIRDPRAVSLSMKNNVIHRSNVYFASKKWCKYINKVMKYKSKKNGRVLDVYFEDLIKYPEKELKKICGFLKIRYRKNMLEYEKDGSSEYHRYHLRIFDGLNKSLDKGKIDQWKRDLTEKEISVVESACRREMKLLGYKPSMKFRKVGKCEIFRFYFDRGCKMFLQIMQYLVYWPEYFFYSIYRKIVFKTFFSEVARLSI
jgi:hypothetical protein